MRLWPWSWERRNQELQEELETHLRMTIEDRVARGETPDQAHSAAMKEMGNLLLVADTTRSYWGLEPIERFAKSVRYALRQLRRSPSFAITAVLGPIPSARPSTAVIAKLGERRN